MRNEEKELIKRRKSAKGVLTRLHNYVQEFNIETDDIQQLFARLPALESVYETIDEIQTKLEIIDYDKNSRARDEVEEKYFSTKAAINRFTKEHEASNITASRITVNSSATNDEVRSHISNSSINIPQVKLPDIHLPNFTGDYREWKNFKDLFEAVIDSNTQIQSIQKLYYLKGALKGEAQKIIQAVEVYEVAWKLLKERYDNKQFNVNCHLKALFDLPGATKDSVSTLRKLLTDTKQHLRSLEALQIPVKDWDAILIYLLCNKLDPSTRRDWEMSKKEDALTTLEIFYKFLEQRCLALEFVNQDKFKNTNKSAHATLVSTNVTKSKPCKICKQNFHSLYQCDTFLKYDIENKIKAIKSSGACFNCLRFGHSSSQCNSRGCKTCQGKHNTLIHQEKREERKESERPTQDSEVKPTDQNVSLHNAIETNQVLLSTARVKVLDSQGFWRTHRAILDSASQLNFITREVVNQLNHETNMRQISINGINGTSAEANELIQLTIGSRTNNFKRKLEFIVLDNITCTLPACSFNTSDWNIPENIHIADPEFNEPGSIDILLGGEIFYDILEHGHLKLGKNLPILQNTRLGWIIGGKIGKETTQKVYASKQALLITADKSLENSLTRFWEIEDTNERKLTLEERQCEEHFQENVSRDSTGRYIVKLPLKTNQNELGNSYQESLRRFKSLEKRLTNNADLKKQYVHFMNEYLTLNHMQLANDDPDKKACYLPHHPVFKNTSSKIRVVFDASMKKSTGISLNDTLMVGPIVQQELMAIVLRFRTHLIVFTADIQKMYRQILVNNDQHDYQRIIWRSDQSQELKSYQLTTVTYGTASAPYLATKSLNQLAVDEAQKYPIAAGRVPKDFYVDDLMTGSDTINNSLILQKEMINLLTEGRFKLHKWCSNRSELLEHVKPGDRETQLPLSIGNNEVKTLGLLWLPAEDSLKFSINVSANPAPETKRKILAEIASIFDPLGVLGPTITIAKLIMQELWKQKINWDEQVPGDVQKIWKHWRDQLSEMKNFQIQRCLFEEKKIDNIEIHGFCDASQAAYGAVLYALTEYSDGTRSVNLICSKARVAPIKQLSLPRLELSGALILARLTKVIPCLELNIKNIFLWTDSMIVLAWLQSTPARWQTFVANRTAEIQEATAQCYWNHVSSEDNPADCLSRGVHLNELIHTKRWWNGPAWITFPKNEWPKQPNNTVEAPEEKITKVSLVSTEEKEFTLFNKYSTLIKLQRVIAYCFRYINNLKNAKLKLKLNQGSLTTDELELSLEFLIKRAQNEQYPIDIAHLNSKGIMSNKSSLTSLNAFLDQKQLLRVGGRIQNSLASFNQRHPIILPKGHILTKLIIEYEHRKLLHGGVQATLTSLRRKFWPINGRSTTRHLINRCITCYRFKASPSEQIMGNLPTYRVQPTRAFLNTGVDYGGPIYIKQGNRRNSPVTKAYISLFVCLCTRAIHIELVNDLSTNSFLMALKRFMARRGKCKTIHSDNSTNFKGASHDLHELYQMFKEEETRNHITEAAANQGVTWLFIPPNAPHFGGIWEAGIKSVKFHLKRIVGKAHLTYEEMYTTLSMIESCLNSRPLIPLTHDPNDFSILTPAHFLIGDLLTCVPEPDLTAQPENRLTRWKQMQQMHQHFWRRWSSDYLSHLQMRHKWNKTQPDAQEGMLVLLKEDNLPPLHWSLAKITKTHPGTDGHVRVVTIRLPNGKELRRPITKICPLPTDDITPKEPGLKETVQGGRNEENKEP